MKTAAITSVVGNAHTEPVGSPAAIKCVLSSITYISIYLSSYIYIYIYIYI